MSRFIKKDEDGFYVFDEREFLKTIPTGLEYFAVDKESKQIYGLGFNYKQKMDKQIADLEAKLAGKDQAIESLEELNRSLGQTCNNDRKEIERLRELISDKEKENDKLTAKLEQADEIINNPDTLIFQQQELIDNLQIIIKEKEKEIEQLNACVDFYKSYYISFKEKVIDELEKVKGLIANHTQELWTCENDDIDVVLYEEIDNQIKQLKEVK